MKYVFVYQCYIQQFSLTQEDVVENVLCNVYEAKAFGKTYLKFKPVRDEHLDNSDSDSAGDIDTVATDEV